LEKLMVKSRPSAFLILQDSPALPFQPHLNSISFLNVIAKMISQMISQLVKILNRQVLQRWLWTSGLVVCLWMLSVPLMANPALAGVDPYITQYLKASQPVEIKVDAQGNTSSFTPEALNAGFDLFSNNCKSCHVGGANVTIPQYSLSLATLKAATPPRDNVAALVDFQRLPMSYDGSEESVWCRQVTENWMSKEQLEDLAGFILRAAEFDKGWGQGTVTN
jgi:photosystem II cytochrome c550